MIGPYRHEHLIRLNDALEALVQEAARATGGRPAVVIRELLACCNPDVLPGRLPASRQNLAYWIVMAQHHTAVAARYQEAIARTLSQTPPAKEAS